MNGTSIREAGDSALLLQLEGGIDAQINARVLAIADAVRRELVPGVRDVVSTYRSVAVHFDPLQLEAGEVRALLERVLTAPVAPPRGKTVEVPVAYGSEYGPDLEEVARFAGLSPREVIERHASAEYRVFMLGFLPGFAYLGKVDGRIAAPRRASPRLRVPGGSVGIAGEQTGIYPRQSPGGWQLIGRTAMRLFDPARAPSAILAPGDSVRFVPVDFADVVFGVSRVDARVTEALPEPGARSVTVLRPGILTTVQDLGRRGHEAAGVTASGALDQVAHRVANALVGNEPDAATLEATISGPELRFDHDATIAVTGADLAATLDGSTIPLRRSVVCRAGSTLQFGARRSGARACIAFDGGVNVPRALGSRATHVLSGIGGIDGRALVAGDRVPLGPRSAAPPERRIETPLTLPAGGARVRVLPGPQDDWFPDPALETLQRTRFTVGVNSDRMGYRLTGAGRIARNAGEMITDATFAGGIQIPPSGEPIVLMADRQTTGGYPQIATVITADLPAVGQLAPGDWIEFEVCSRSEAISALRAQEAMLREWA